MYKSNLDLFYKVQRVIMSCNNLEQFKVARQYVQLSQKFLTYDWNMDLVQIVVEKERNLSSK